MFGVLAGMGAPEELWVRGLPKYCFCLSPLLFHSICFPYPSLDDCTICWVTPAASDSPSDDCFNSRFISFVSHIMLSPFTSFYIQAEETRGQPHFGSGEGIGIVRKRLRRDWGARREQELWRLIVMSHVGEVATLYKRPA